MDEDCAMTQRNTNSWFRGDVVVTIVLQASGGFWFSFFGCVLFLISIGCRLQILRFLGLSDSRLHVIISCSPVSRRCGFGPSIGKLDSVIILFRVRVSFPIQSMATTPKRIDTFVASSSNNTPSRQKYAKIE